MPTIGRSGFGVALLLGALAAFGGCHDPETSPPVVPSGAETTVLVAGTVLSIDDGTPYDGGVIISLATGPDRTIELRFGSLFTYPPPTPERFALYETIRSLAPGDRVVACGHPTEAGIDLTGIVKIAP
jgi:hypothetical protein